MLGQSCTQQNIQALHNLERTSRGLNKRFNNKKKIKHQNIIIQSSLNQSLKQLPAMDWSRYHLQVLFVDKTDILRARVAMGLFERITAWNGYGYVLYPHHSGTRADQKNSDISTTASLMLQAPLMGIPPTYFSSPQMEFESIDVVQHDIIVPVDLTIANEVQTTVKNSQFEHYQTRIVDVTQFWDLVDDQELLRVGGSVLLPENLSKILESTQNIQRLREIGACGIPRPDLKDGNFDTWKDMLGVSIIVLAGMCKYMMSSWKEGIVLVPDYDPL
eukprot:TRINITY_DN4821_c2_g1_i2.p1 TRINITY_DN4821_c2_g1~~TRINITY_DN4821_c2_g1_i2.p1  ORF type:complete len:274 (+),score=38.49 TRINITY_DN4821_c2_g1_i2:112-933(+)